jgi:hypothetical protein
VRLGSPLGPVWLDQLDGSSWLTEVHDPLVVDLYARRRDQALQRRRPAGDDPDALLEAEAWADYEATVWLARRTVRDWRDMVWDDTGEPVPCEPDVVAQALAENPGAAAVFRNRFFAALSRWAVEKKGSATSPPGTGTAPPSAGDASPTPPAAPVASAAPPSPAAPAARRASRSGRSSARAGARSGAATWTGG